MDTNDWINIIAIKKLVVDATGAMQDDSKAIATAVSNLNKAACILHDMETQYIQQNKIGTLLVGV